MNTNSEERIKNIILFDMDGTLTPPRKKIDRKVITSLRDLSMHAEIGIVTGSDFDYLMQQCEPMFGIGGVPCDKIHLLPCNGTKYYKWGNGRRFHLTSNSDMIEKIKRESYNSLLSKLFSYQLKISSEHNLPYTGTFFHYRGSMLNWCPIGRLAGDAERESWIQSDKESEIRKSYLEEIESFFQKEDISCHAALGGSTSIDIFPKGWDKTYSLKYFQNYATWFVGDKCTGDGNDRTIFELLGKSNRSFSTTGPSNTSEIISLIIEKINLN